jgi:hypothetical protein
MGDTPKPSNLVLFHKPKKARADGTQEYDLRSSQAVVRPPLPTSVADDRPTDPDGPPTDQMEIPIPLTELAAHSAAPADPLSFLETVTFDRGVVVRSEKESRGPKYFEILSGYAEMCALDGQGQGTNNPRTLEPGHFIGLIGFARVVTTTELTARVYDLPKIAAMNRPDLQVVAQGRLFAASSDLATTFLRENGALRGRVVEYDAMLRGKLDTLKDGIRKRFIDPLRAQLAEKDEYIRRLEKDRIADSQSLVLVLDEFEGLVEEGVIDKSEKRLAELVTIIDGLLDAVLRADDMALRQKAMHVQSALFAFKMKGPKAPKPAT